MKNDDKIQSKVVAKWRAQHNQRTKRRYFCWRKLIDLIFVSEGEICYQGNQKLINLQIWVEGGLLKRSLPFSEFGREDGQLFTYRFGSSHVSRFIQSFSSLFLCSGEKSHFPVDGSSELNPSSLYDLMLNSKHIKKNIIIIIMKNDTHFD